MRLAAGSLFEHLPVATDDECFEELARGRGFRIERIVSHGQASEVDSWCDQEWDEWVMVVRGRAGLEIESRDEPLDLGPGDWVMLPAHLRHRVAWTTPDEPTIWLAVHEV